MFLEYLKIFSPISCLMVNVLAQLLSFRYFPKVGLLRSVYFGFSSGLMLLSCFGLYIFFNSLVCLKDYLGFFVSNLITYVCLSYCYFHFINLGETARRIRILRELYDSKEGLSYEEILQRYNTKVILDIRIKRLIDSHQIEFKDDRYTIAKPLVLVFAKMIVKMKRLLYGKNYHLFV